MKKRLALLAVTALLAVGPILTCAPESRRSNVLLISIDTLRPDHLGCYGYKDIQTPNIDGLASQGFVFTDAIATVPLTLPSHTSLLTGLSPISNGVRDNGAFALSEQFLTLAEVLQARGYATGAFVASFVLDSRFGLDQGFEVYDDDMDPGSQAGAFFWPERRAAAVNEAALRWLEQVKEPFFGFVHYYDPHLPYTPPEPFASDYQGRPYDGEVAYADQAVGKLLEALSRKGLADNTIIILVSDHGEGLQEHQERGHGTLIYDSTIRVVLMVKPASWQDLGADRSSSTTDHPVQLIDVFPTILDLLGIEIDRRVDGVSLVPLLRGERIPSRFLYFESLYPYFYFRWSPLRGIRHNQWKYILAPQQEIYNVDLDPGEEHNLFQEERDLAGQLKANLLEIAGREKTALVDAQRQMTAEDVKKLMALGYLAGGRPTLPEDMEPKGLNPEDMVGRLGELMWSGRGDFDRGDFESAASKFRQMVKEDPGNPQAHVHLAKALIELGRDKEAQAEFRKAVEIDSTHSGAFFPLAQMARRQGDLDKALFYFQVGAQVTPQTPDLLSNIGALLVEKGLPDSAIVVLSQAVKLDPSDFNGLLNLGLAHMAKGQPDQALRWFRSALKVNPSSPKALVNIASIYIGRGLVDSTVSYLEKARSVAPADATIMANLGSAYRQKGMLPQAAQAYLDALELEPENTMALFGLAAVRAQEGNREESVDLLKKILATNPDFQPARQALRALNG